MAAGRPWRHGGTMIQQSRSFRWRARHTAWTMGAAITAAVLPIVLAESGLPRPVLTPPLVPELQEGAGIVANRQAAIALGKALFWDEQTGSDGMACASCHFAAGADIRTRNQLNPGFADASFASTGGDTGFGSNQSDTGFPPGHMPSGSPAGPNYVLSQRGLPAAPALRLHGPQLAADHHHQRRGFLLRGLQQRLHPGQGAGLQGQVQPGGRQCLPRRPVPRAPGGAAQHADHHQRGLLPPQLLGRPRQQPLQRRGRVRYARHRRKIPTSV